jgi:hypothetical protein
MLKHVILFLSLNLFVTLASSADIPSWQIVYHGPYVPNGSDYTILDLFEHSVEDVAKAKFPIAYFSAHYEAWRPDAYRFGKKLHKIPGWKGESYVDWTDRKNQRVMLNRLGYAKEKGFRGVDIDNVDGPGTLAYFQWLQKECRREGLQIGLKNAVEILPKVGTEVDFFVSEATSSLELLVYRKYQKPVVRMYYGKGAKTPDFVFPVTSGKLGNKF